MGFIMSQFEWNKIWKHSDQIEDDITGRVFDYVLDFYDVDDVSELSAETIQELEFFSEEAGLMEVGFRNLIAQWEGA